MKAIEAYYRIIGALHADRYVPVAYRMRWNGDIFCTAYLDDEGFSVALENHPIVYCYAYNMRDADDYDTEDGVEEAFISCNVRFDGDESLVLTTYGTSDNYDDEIEVFKVPFDGDPKELFNAIQNAMDFAIDYLEQYESEYHGEHDFDIDEDAAYEAWRDQQYE